MATAEALNHRAVSDRFLDHAQDELDGGDLLQASEKAWGALAHYVKAIAEERGWENDSHSDVMAIAQGLVEVAAAPRRQGAQLRSARLLHVNFYEDELNSDQVQGGIDDTKDLIAALKEAEHRFPIRKPNGDDSPGDGAEAASPGRLELAAQPPPR